jgi:ABC-type hemin transport system substrate-binding protein
MARQARAKWATTLPGAGVRVVSGLDATVMDQLIGAFMWTRTATVHGRRVIALDGNTLRGAGPRTATTTPAAQSAEPHGWGNSVSKSGENHLSAITVSC